MSSRTVFLLILVASAPLAAQTRTWSPLGVLVSPQQPIHVPSDFRSVLPKNAKVRLLASTHLAIDGETSLVYDLGKFGSHSHIAVIKSGRRIADFRLGDVFPPSAGAEDYTFIQAAETEEADRQHVLITAFQNVGDGSGTLFALLVIKNGAYEVNWKQGTHQGRFKEVDGGKVELWNGEGDGDCVWCDEHYTVTTYIWRDGTFHALTHIETRKALGPYKVSVPAIVLAK